MARAHSILSSFVQLERPAAAEGRGEASAILLEGDRRLRVDPANPKARGFVQVLAGLEALRHPVYVEMDPASETVARLFVPAVGLVSAVRETEKGLEIGLSGSHARFLLARDDPDFAAVAATLREALGSDRPVMLAADDAQHVLDVRFFTPGPDDRPAARPGILPRPDLLGAGGRPFIFWPWARGCISMARAQQIFNAMSAQTCAPAAIAPPCIPFLYPDDGCWGRAHEMRRLMLNMGVTCRKVWIMGHLHTPTRNNPNCFVDWNWHVAPIVCVITGYRFGFIPITQTMVIDPSLFTKPVTEAQWKSVQGDPNATLAETDGSIFYYWGNVTDPTYVQTNQVLATYRLALQNRVNQVGPPPYANCP